MENQPVEDIAVPGGRLYLTPDQVRYMEAMWERQKDRPPTITLMPEYCVEVPLWPQADETKALIPALLMTKLMAWQALFDANFRWRDGWKSDSAKEAWAEEAVHLEAELREAVAGVVEVDVDLWPMNPGFVHTYQIEFPPPE